MIDNTLTNAERETIISQTADDRSKWHVFTDDPIQARRLQKLGAARLPSRPGTAEFELSADQVLIRRGKRSTSPATAAAAGQRLAAARTASKEKAR